LFSELVCLPPNAYSTEHSKPSGPISSCFHFTSTDQTLPSCSKQLLPLAASYDSPAIICSTLMRTTNISFTALTHTILSGTHRLHVWGMFCCRLSCRELHTASANNWPDVVHFVRRSSGWMSQLQQTDSSCTPAPAYHSFSVYSLPNVVISHIPNYNYGSYRCSQGSPPPVTP